MLPTCKRRGLPLLNSLTRIVAWHVTWLIHLGREWCQCGCSVIYTTPTYVPEHFYPCGPGAHKAIGPEEVFLCVCMIVYVCVCDYVGTTGSGAQVSRGMVPGPWACLLS